MHPAALQTGRWRLPGPELYFRAPLLVSYFSCRLLFPPCR